MTQPVSPRDARLLSEYLDGQLKPRLRTRLEARLEAESGLRQALDDMARTCRLLRSQEPLRAPRNFTLTAAMVGGKKPAPPPTYPVFGLVSAVTALLLILVLTGDWLSRGVFLSRPEALLMSQVAGEEQAVGESASEPMPGAEAMMTGAVEAQPAAEAPALEMAVEAQPTATPEPLLRTPDAQPAPSAKSAADTSADESARSMAPADQAAPADLEETASGIGGRSLPLPGTVPLSGDG